MSWSATSPMVGPLAFPTKSFSRRRELHSMDRGSHPTSMWKRLPRPTWQPGRIREWQKRWKSLAMQIRDNSGFSHAHEEFVHAEPPIFFELLQCESRSPVLDRFDDLLMLVNGNVDQRKLPHIETFVSPDRQPQPLNGILEAAIRARSQEGFMPAVVQNEGAFWVTRGTQFAIESGE